MSADKPIQRYDNYYYEMDERPEGQYVTYSDHIAAIRKARAEAIKDAREHLLHRSEALRNPTFPIHWDVPVEALTCSQIIEQFAKERA